MARFREIEAITVIQGGNATATEWRIIDLDRVVQVQPADGSGAVHAVLQLETGELVRTTATYDQVVAAVAGAKPPRIP